MKRWPIVTASQVRLSGFVNHLCGYGGRPPYMLDDDGNRCFGYGLSGHIRNLV